MDEVCRLCLADTTSCDEYTSYDGRIHLLMPEIDLNITPTFNLCEDCSDTLNNAYTFKQKCLQIEERINNYISNAQTPLTNLRCVRDQTYNYIKESLDEVDVNIKEEYDKDDNNSITNWANVEDYKDIDSISEEYHLTFPKDEIVPQYKDEYASNRRKEGIEEICKESFKSSTELETNIFPNDSCNKKFSKDPRLTEPTIITSEKTNPYFCHICNRGFKRKRYLDNHSQAIHTNKTYTCPICSKTCRYLQDHMRNSHNKKHICQVCNKQHGSKHNLQQHMLGHTGERPYKCEICGKDFVMPKSLDEHMTTHQSSNLEKRFVCKITNCNSRFRTEMLLYHHVRRHLCTKKHQCSLCDESFSLPSLLKAHMWSHTGVKRFECHICHKNYSTKYVLQHHLKSHDRMKI